MKTSQLDFNMKRGLTSAGSLADYLKGRKRERDNKLLHTHTAFGAIPTSTLHIAKDAELREKLLTHVQHVKDLSHGANAVTEKIQAKSKFRLFFDIDLKTESVQQYLAQEGTDQTSLIQELKKIPECVKEVLHKILVSVEVCVLVLATRLPYKMHLHCPDVIVTAVEAKRICGLVKDALKESKLYDDGVIDTSVYSTGLRMLWCHKGNMGKAEKIAEEKRQHEMIFGKGSWSAVYEITDLDTWEKKAEKTLVDLELTSIVADPESELTQLAPALTSPSQRRRSIDRKGKGTAPVVPTTNTRQLSIIAAYLEELSLIPASEIRTNEQRVQGGRLIIPTRHRQCPLARREHSSNQQYFVLTLDYVERRCHAEACSESTQYPISALEVKESIASILSDDNVEDIITTPGIRSTTPTSGAQGSEDRVQNADLTFLNRLLDTSVDWSYEQRKLPGGKNGYQIIPQCKMCLVDPLCEHNSVGHSCLYINKSSVTKSCFTCGSQTVPSLTAKKIINQFNVIVLQVPASEDNTYQKLRNEILDLASKELYKRDSTGAVYKPIHGLSYGYARYMDAKEFLNDVFLDDERFSDNPNNIDKLEKFLKDYGSSRFPFLKPDQNILGFRNGVLDITTCEFTTVASGTIKKDLIARKFFDVDLNIDDLSTPLFDQIVGYQFPNNPDVSEFLLMCIGRLFFRVQERDNWGFMVYLLGEAGTGKSTIMDIISAMFDRIGSIASGYEEKFGLEGLYNMDLVLIDDVPKNIQNIFPQQTFQSCVTGNKLPINFKYGTSKTIDWKVPFIMGGNWRLEYLDKGQVSRRIVEFEFTRQLTSEDPTLKRKILSDEIAPLMMKCLVQYKAAVEEHSDHGVWQFCPDYFREQQQEMRMERNPFYGFLSTSDRIVFEEGVETPLYKVKDAFAQYLGKGVKKLDRGTLKQVNERWQVHAHKVCKSCKGESRKGCCAQYGHSNRTSSEVVHNLRIKE